MVKYIDIEEFLKLEKENLPIIDVRSPSEYNHAHIPQAYNVYLFNDNERKEIGTIYKQIGREEAVLKGLEFVSPRMTNILKSIVEDKLINIECDNLDFDSITKLILSKI